MQVRKTLAAAAVAASPLLLAAPAHADTVSFSLDDINGTGANATATITTNANGSMTVDIQGTGFTPNMPHAQHLHGAVDGGFFCPSDSADEDGDGLISTVEGVPAYGGVMISLTTKGDTSADSGLAVKRFPVADAQGNLDYQRTIPASGVPDGVVENLENLHIVQHGIDVNGNDKYDMDGLGESPFAKSLGVEGIPAEATFPATCGEVTPAGAVETGSGSTEGIESMSLLGLGGAAVIGSAGFLAYRRRFAEDVQS